ncbi:MAG: hypothetical protein ABI995_03075, partial [Acidobacteriota bacterium]
MPIVLMTFLAAFLFARSRPDRRRFVVTIVVAAAGLMSLIYSIWATDYDQPSAFFNTLTRI